MKLKEIQIILTIKDEELLEAYKDVHGDIIAQDVAECPEEFTLSSRVDISVKKVFTVQNNPSQCGTESGD